MGGFWGSGMLLNNGVNLILVGILQAMSAPSFICFIRRKCLSVSSYLLNSSVKQTVIDMSYLQYLLKTTDIRQCSIYNPKNNPQIMQINQKNFYNKNQYKNKTNQKIPKSHHNPMDDNFTNNAESVYLASLTQAKKILYLERQLSNSQHYCKNLQQDLAATKLTMNRLIKQRTNNQVLAKMSENLYRMQRKCREMQEFLKQNNAKLLIQMQLRLQEKAQYSQKIRELEEQIQSIRKTNKDKQQQFTIIVNKLRKYEDIRQLMLDDKLITKTGGKQSKDTKEGKQMRKNLLMKEEDKDVIIKELNQELNYFKNFSRDVRIQLDKKVAVLAYALESQRNYHSLKQEVIGLIYGNDRRSGQMEKLMIQSIGKSGKPYINSTPILSIQTQLKPYPQHIPTPVSNPQKPNPTLNLNQKTTQLIKQLKKLVISNKLLESALNESTQKNQQLIIYNQILSQSNLELKQQLEQYYRKQTSVILINRKKGSVASEKDGGNNYQNAFSKNISRASDRTNKKVHEEDFHKIQKITSPKKDINISSDQNLRMTEIKSIQQIQTHDDHRLNHHSNNFTDIPEIIRQRRLKQYLQTLKSKDYDVNVQMLYKDVHRMGEFLILALGSRSKDILEAKQRPTYGEIIQRQYQNKNKVIHKRSISTDAKLSQNQLDNPRFQPTVSNFGSRNQFNNGQKNQVKITDFLRESNKSNTNQINSIPIYSKDGKISIDENLHEEMEEIYIEEF